MLSADLLLKGLGGLAVVGGATVGIFYLKQNKTEKLSDLADRVGLSCTFDGDQFPTAGVVCNKSTKADSKVKVKKDTGTFDATSITGGKIKAYEDKTYNKGFKFVIEEADVTTNDSNKLEEFETYEIKKDEGNKKEWRLTRKTDVNAGIKKALGLPESSDCDLSTTAEIECDISGDKFKKVNFDGKGETDEAVSGTPKLKISKLENTDTDFGTYKFKFVLESDQDSKISKTVTIKKGTNTEFKIKATPESGGPKKLTLEKTWSLDELIKKVGITSCAANGGTAKECSFSASTKVNLFNDTNNYTKQATVKSGDESKKIKVEENQENHSQGFMFYVTDESSEITLENGTPTAGTDKKITKKDTASGSPTYEIKEQFLSGETKNWYLSKVTTAK